jgi:hypothetical protein
VASSTPGRAAPASSSTLAAPGLKVFASQGTHSQAQGSETGTGLSVAPAGAAHALIVKVVVHMTVLVWPNSCSLVTCVNRHSQYVSICLWKCSHSP